MKNMKQQLIRQILWNRLIAVVEEQAQVLMRTAFSPIVRECGDLSAGVFDRQGRMLAQAVTGTPGHVNSMAESVRHFIRHFPLDQMQPGDAYITNDPWMGTGHLNDFVVTTPAFKNGKLVALFSCTSHLMDIGGIGFGPDGTDVTLGVVPASGGKARPVRLQRKEISFGGGWYSGSSFSCWESDSCCIWEGCRPIGSAAIMTIPSM